MSGPALPRRGLISQSKTTRHSFYSIAGFPSGTGCVDGSMACVPRQDCTQVEQLYSIRESESIPRKEKDQATDMLRGLVCDKKKRLFCCRSRTLTNNGT